MIQERVVWVGFEVSFKEADARQFLICNVLFSRLPAHSISAHGCFNAELQGGYNAYMEHSGKVLQDATARAELSQRPGESHEGKPDAGAIPTNSSNHGPQSGAYESTTNVAGTLDSPGRFIDLRV